jgi:hypothetical protein
MNSFFMEFLIKERQQQILNEIRRNQISRANSNLKGEKAVILTTFQFIIQAWWCAYVN